MGYDRIMIVCKMMDIIFEKKTIKNEIKTKFKSHIQTFIDIITWIKYIRNNKFIQLINLRKVEEQIHQDKNEQWKCEDIKYNPGKVVILESHSFNY